MAQNIYLVTGVTRQMGLGFGLVKGLLAQGHFVYAAERDPNDVTVLLKKVPADVRDRSAPLAIDLTNRETVNHAAEAITERHGRLDALINNAAGYFDAGNTLLNTETDMLVKAFDANVIGTVRMVQGLLPLLRKSPGATIVNVTSGAGSFHDQQFGMETHPQHVPVYAMTKAAANAFTVKLAKELATERMKVNAVCPGWIATYPGTAGMGARPVAEAVPTSGKFYRDQVEIDW